MTQSKSTNYISQWVAFIPPAKAGGFSAPTKINLKHYLTIKSNEINKVSFHSFKCFKAADFVQVNHSAEHTTPKTIRQVPIFSNGLTMDF